MMNEWLAPVPDHKNDAKAFTIIHDCAVTTRATVHASTAQFSSKKRSMQGQDRMTGQLAGNIAAWEDSAECEDSTILVNIDVALRLMSIQAVVSLLKYFMFTPEHLSHE